MAKIKPGKAFEKAIPNGFGGIRYTAALTGESAARMRNFRVASDGSLEKRNGMVTRYRSDGSVRAAWQGSLDGGNYFFFVSGNRVYVRLPGSETPGVCNLFPSADGPAFFVPYRGVLYLFASGEIYRFSTASGSFFTANGYAPLYGDNWHPTELGHVNEPINLLTPHLRVRYLNTVGSVNFRLPYTTVSIDRVEVDGVAVNDYTFTPNTTTFRIPSDKAHGALTVSFTISPAFIGRSLIAGAGGGYVYRGAARETLLLYGGYRVFDSAPVTDAMLSAASYWYPNATDPLYFRDDCGLYVGDTQHPVHALCRDRDRVLALNDQTAWAIEDVDGELVSYPLEGSAGCSAPNGLVLCGDDPVVLRRDGVFRLRFPSGDSNVCVSVPLSDGVSELLPSSLLTGGIAAWHVDRGELWLRDPAETAEGLVWVLRPEKQEWYCFDNVPATVFFDLDGSPAFGTADGRIVLSDNGADADDGNAISATYQSHYLAFSEPETPKRAYRLSVCADTGGETLSIHIQTDRYSRSFWAFGEATDAPAFFDCRVSAGRFRFLRYTLSISGQVRSRIYRLSVFANP